MNGIVRSILLPLLLTATIAAVALHTVNHLVLEKILSQELTEVAQLQNNNLRVFWELCGAKGSAFRLEGGALWCGNYRINGNNEIPDKVLDLTGSRATVFMGDVRVATNVPLADGRRALWTVLANPARRAVLVEGRSYRGEAAILGVPYYTAYDPIRNRRGEVIGALFVGMDRDHSLEAYRRMSFSIRAINASFGAGIVLCALLLLMQKRRSEEVLRERGRLEAKAQHSAMMEALMVHLSHDLKTPLTPLCALLPLMIRETGDPRLVRMLEICRDNVEQIRGMAEKSLQMVKLSSRSSDLWPLELAPLAEQAILETADELSRRGVSCQNLIPAGIHIMGSMEQLDLLFTNLLSNAARYAAGAVVLTARVEGNRVVVEVRDDGVGLDPEHTALIFTEFFKTDGARHDTGRQGLGLAICQRILYNHGGSIWAESPGPGLGTSIFFTLKGAPPP
ncbi:hypothetical protein GMSM_23270 [Geomonas sp. Red276]